MVKEKNGLIGIVVIVIWFMLSIWCIDVSEIAEKLGGGGHKNAAGCLVSWKQFYDMFLN